jgi:hypothetical protein
MPQGLLPVKLVLAKAGKGQKNLGFPASSAGQALLEFTPMKIGAGMTSLKTTHHHFKPWRVGPLSEKKFRGVAFFD